VTAFFITAAGTEIGKTYVTAGLIRALRRQGRAVEALKPVASGFDPDRLASTDTGVLLSVMERAINVSEAAGISPWRFAAPLSPDMAARREGRSIDFDRLVEFCRRRIAEREDVLLIEGVGGCMVPLDDSHTVLDWMSALDLPALVVTGSYLGAISHTLTALETLRSRNLTVAALIVNETPGSTVDLDETAATIRRFARGVQVLTLAYMPNPDDHAPTLDGLSRSF
jgi:dethiobiotin synthetase